MTEIHGKQPRNGEVGEGFQVPGVPGMPSGWAGLSQAGTGKQDNRKYRSKKTAWCIVLLDSLERGQERSWSPTVTLYTYLRTLVADSH